MCVFPSSRPQMCLEFSVTLSVQFVQMKGNQWMWAMYPKGGMQKRLGIFHSECINFVAMKIYQFVLVQQHRYALYSTADHCIVMPTWARKERALLEQSFPSSERHSQGYKNLFCSTTCPIFWHTNQWKNFEKLWLVSPFVRCGNLMEAALEAADFIDTDLSFAAKLPPMFYSRVTFGLALKYAKETFSEPL